MPKILQINLGEQAAELRPPLQCLANQFTAGNLSALVRMLADGELLPAMLEAPTPNGAGEESADAPGPLLPILLGSDDEYLERRRALKTLAALYAGGSMSALVRALADGQLLERVRSEMATVEG